MDIFLSWRSCFAREAGKVFFWIRKGLLVVCASLSSFEKARIVQDEISMSVVAVAGWKCMKAYTSTLIGCYTPSSLSRVCLPLMILFDSLIGRAKNSGQSALRRNCDEKLLHISPSSRTEPSSSDAV